MSLLLVSTTGDRRFPLTGRPAFITGREPTCPLPMLGPAVWHAMSAGAAS